MSSDVSRRTGLSARARNGVLARLAHQDVPGPQWLAPARHAALAWVCEHGFPTQKHEDWRYTRLDPLLGLALEPAAPGQLPDAAAAAGRAADLGGPRLVFVNGHFSSALSELGPLPAGASVLDMASAVRDRRTIIEAAHAGTDVAHSFTALNEALSPDGVFVHLADGVELPEPIHVVFVAGAGSEQLLASPRSMFALGKHSRAQIVESHIGAAGPSNTAHCTNAVTEVRLGPGAQLEHHTLENDTSSGYHLAFLDVHQQAGSHFASHSIMLGGAIARQEMRVRLAGEGAQVHLDGLYLPEGSQVHDNTVFIDHAVGGCSSQQLYKGVLAGHGRGVFNGHIVVREGADGTDAHQVNKNLLLSDRAEADTRPRLEIYTDDVQCTHGAAVGQLDQEALLYLRSRGIDEQAARQVLVRAFAQEMLDRIPLEPLREQVSELISARVYGD